MIPSYPSHLYGFLGKAQGFIRLAIKKAAMGKE
jgi:hypothetical protein